MERFRFAASVVIVLGLMPLIQRTASGQDGKGIRVTLASATNRKLAPNFALKDTAGKLVRLSDYRGRVVLLDFWATACGGCVKEIPAFVELAKAYERRGLSTLGVSEDIVYEDLKSADEAWDRVRPFVRDHKVSYRVVMGDGQITSAYDIKALPLTYLIDSDGRVAAVYTGVVDRANLEANIKALLAESP
jgi:peroxiredoxin